jgi:hypothetical protein
MGLLGEQPILRPFVAHPFFPKVLTMRPLLLSLAALAMIAFPPSTALAETVLTQWNFNALTGANVPVIGSGTLGGYGQGAPSAPLSSIVYNGTLVDSGTVVTGTTFNRALTVNPPLISTTNNSTGLWFSAPTTGMQPGQQVKLSWSQTIGFRSSRYWQVLTSTVGGTSGFSVPSGATGSSISQFVTGYTGTTQATAISGTATVNVSSTGLIDFRTIGSGTLGNLLTPAVTTLSGTTWPNPLAAGFVDNISITLPTGQGFENNANFAFAIVGAFDPSLSAVSGTTGYVSSFTGLDSTNVVTGYNRSAASGGSMRLDLVTITAVPEPSALVLAVLGVAAGCWASTRRRLAKRS